MGSLPSRRKATAAQASPESNLRNSQGLGVKPPGGDTPIVVAVSSFPSDDAEPTVRMGEQLNLLSEDGDWCNVQSTLTGKNCYIPSSHIAKVFHGWLYEGISRAKAEELLLLPSNQEGSFLLRERQMKRGCYCLSIRHRNYTSQDCVKHYRINSLENNWLYISPSNTFSSLQELVDYYSEIGDGLCCSLRKPCLIERPAVGFCCKPVVVKPSALNWQEINSVDLLVENPIPANSPISLGLRETVTSYLFMTEDQAIENVLGKNEK